MDLVQNNGTINVPAENWDEVIAFYTQELGPPISNDGTTAIFQLGTNQLILVKDSSRTAITGDTNAYVGLPTALNNALRINVLPAYSGQRGNPAFRPYTILIKSIEARSTLTPVGQIVFGVIYNPPY